ncbi:unnamed protein product, partial [Brassica oleracea var. botrytis]
WRICGCQSGCSLPAKNLMVKGLIHTTNLSESNPYSRHLIRKRLSFFVTPRLGRSYHKPKTHHSPMIRDLDEFLVYPWGRVSFEMLVTGIKKKDEIILSQPSIALPGFVDAIQLVFMAAVPQIKEIVPQVEP